MEYNGKKAFEDSGNKYFNFFFSNKNDLKKGNKIFCNVKNGYFEHCSIRFPLKYYKNDCEITICSTLF